MTFVVSAVTVATSLYNAKRSRDAQKKAAKDARKDQLQDQANARKAEVFAETEGEGQGALGQVSLEMDDGILDEGELNSKMGRTTISI